MLIVFFIALLILLTALLLYLSYAAFFDEKNWKRQAVKLHKLLVKERKNHQLNQSQLKQKAYHAEVLHELSQRIGYSLNIYKIIEVITGSLGEVLDYHTASYITLENDHLKFHCYVSQSVNHQFIKDVQKQMIRAFSAMLNSNISDKYIEETISGTILDDTIDNVVNSFFNLPLVISGQIVGLINVASPKKDLYTESETRILYTITRQAADHYEKLKRLLQEEKRRLNAMVSSMVDGVIMLDKETQLIVFNHAAKEMLGLAKIKEPTILDIANSLSGKIDLRTKLDEALGSNKVVEQKDIYLENKALHLLVSPVKDSKGELLGSAILFRDVTAEKELEQVREEFTAMMVHELRSPLTAIKGTTDMVLTEKRLSIEMKNQFLKTMKSDAENMLNLVGDILDVAKIDAGKFQIEPQENDLAQTIQDVLNKFAAEAKQKELEIKTDIAKNMPRIMFDQLRLSQVLNNLLSNAIKYTERGQIKVTVVKDKHYATVSVEDSGVGMSSSEVARLFSKFKQFGKGKSGEIRGTGLGLVIAKGIIENHGGKIWAKSEGPGRGSKFSFSLPLKQAKQRKERR